VHGTEKFCFELLHILRNFLFYYFGVDLRCSDGIMSEHGAYGFDGNAIGQGDCGRKGMACNVGCDFLLDSANIRELFQVAVVALV